MVDTTDKSKRHHKATYARDKRAGGYLIRVVGPEANRFVGREVPVVTQDGSEHKETLNKLIWTGIDDGQVIASDAGKPVALYEFEQKPRVEKEAEF